MSARTTRHATKRTRERLGLQKKSVERNTEKALEFGISHKEATGNLRKYMDGLYLSNKKATNMRIYHEHTYIFCGQTLITVLPLPNSLKALAHKLEEQKKR